MKIKFKKNKFSLFEKMIYKVLKEEINGVRSEIETVRDLFHSDVDSLFLYDQRSTIKKLYDTTRYPEVKDYIIQSMATVYRNADLEAQLKIGRLYPYLKDGLRGQEIKIKDYKKPEKKNFRKQNLSGSDFSHHDTKLMNFNLASLEGSDFSESLIRQANFRYANLNNVNFQNSKIIRIYFEGTDLQNADFSGAHLQQVNFDGCDLRGAKFEQADLDRIRIYDSDLRGANLSGVNMEKLKSIFLANYDDTTKFPEGYDPTSFENQYWRRIDKPDNE